VSSPVGTLVASDLRSHRPSVDPCHTRVAYSEIHNDEKGDTASGLLAFAAKFYATVGIERIEAVMTDNHWSYTNSRAVAAVLADLWVLTTSQSGPTADGRTGK
jgi:hypothetical protein